MTFNQTKYAISVSRNLEKSRVLSSSPLLIDFRCCFCGDSKKKKNKKRGYIYENETNVYYHCHNCGKHLTFASFLKDFDRTLYQEMRIESLGSDRQRLTIAEEKKSDHAKNIDLGVSAMLSQECQEYLDKRMIDTRFRRSIYYVDDINFISSQLESHQSTEFNHVPAIVIPFYDKTRNYSYICCRLLGSGDFRYIVFKKDDVLPKIWGIEFVDFNRPVFVFEGPIDAMCAKNSIAVSGIGGSKIKYISENIESPTFVYDNEIRDNRQIRNEVVRCISSGHTVFIPDERFRYKDANEAICAGWTKDFLTEYIGSRSFSRARATLELSYHLKTWRKKK